ncbi:carbon-nitrogen hydrolase [Lignipirellula cremea]|uniref:N-carbamoyl-D-amino acid hydrolase n=1 Tax=Lignipirellula cremea TaxID=2528010 RepID=A0A518E2A9_9BACT|nr:carbon-nitrogen hydrolase [Lignipirellula cremea]QDU98221.1 N-carbamoyl-D-amino acid hydrolase [Lignipirellula cremea]
MSSSPASELLTLGLIQMSCVDDKTANVEKALERIAEAAARGAQVICLQELFHNHYPCQTEDHARFAEAEPIPGPITEALSQAAAKHGVVVIGSLFEKRAAGLYHNTAVVFDADGSLLGMYRKMHIPDDPLFYEKFYFTPGDLGFRAFQTRFGKVAVCVCWDQWFPEAARLTAMQGAQVIFYPTAIGWLSEEKETFGTDQHSAWQTMMRSHAIANGVYIAAPNRVGSEGALEFWGGSFVADPYGVVAAQASHDEEEILLFECDLAKIDVARTHWPFLRDRRIDAYQGITRRWLEE